MLSNKIQSEIVAMVMMAKTICKIPLLFLTHLSEISIEMMKAVMDPKWRDKGRRMIIKIEGIDQLNNNQMMVTIMDIKDWLALPVRVFTVGSANLLFPQYIDLCQMRMENIICIQMQRQCNFIVNTITDIRMITCAQTVKA